MEVGLTAKSSNMETVVNQMGLAAHMALMCGTTFMDALSKMVQCTQVIALFTMP